MFSILAIVAGCFIAIYFTFQLLGFLLNLISQIVEWLINLALYIAFFIIGAYALYQFFAFLFNVVF